MKKWRAGCVEQGFLPHLEWQQALKQNFATDLWNLTKKEHNFQSTTMVGNDMLD